MVDFREITAVEGIYIPENKKKEAYGADVLLKRGEMTLLVRYQYRTKDLAKQAVDALKKKNANAMPYTDLPRKAFLVCDQKVR